MEHNSSELLFDKEAKNTQWRKHSVFNKWQMGKLDNHMQKNEIGPLPYIT